ncbi:MAG: hypothetical protein J5651_00155 [Salinivirgaceae bacterium]|nr:hypothetical protein [Salinivirgaceae bacterium]
MDFKTDINLNGNKLLNATVANAEPGKILKIGSNGNIEPADTYTIDIDNKQLVVSAGNDRYFAALTKLTKPNTPTIAAAQLAKSVVTGSAVIEVSGIDSGATAYYKIADTAAALANVEYTQISNGKFSIASGFSTDADNSALTKYVKVKAIKNGVSSDEATQPYTIVITPKVAQPALSVDNSDQYAATATVIISKSATNDAITEYSVDGGTNWTELTENSKTITVSDNQSAGAYKVKATKANYTVSDTSQSSAIVVNKKYIYCGAQSSNSAPTQYDASMTKEKTINENDGVTISNNVNDYIFFLTTDSSKANIQEFFVGQWVNITRTTKTTVQFTMLNGLVATYYCLMSDKQGTAEIKNYKIA